MQTPTVLRFSTLAVSRRLAGALAVLVLALLPAAAPARADDLTHLTIARGQSSVNQHLTLGLNKSLIVDLPTDASEIIVSQPTVATAAMRSKRRAVLQGMGIGDTNIMFLDARGAQIAALEISVLRDGSTLSTALARVLPGSNISVQAFGDRLVLSGTAASQDDVAKALVIAGQFAGGDANVANVITVTGAQQVALKVTVAEVSRSAVKQLGINLTGSLTVGAVSGTFSSPSVLGGASSVVTGNSVGSALNLPNLSIDATLHALEQRGLLRKLDEPTLTAMSGQAAEFAAGGEIPILNPPDSQGQVSYTYKQLGVKLDFTPVVKSNGIIGLTIDSSVSDIDNTFAVTVGNASIPGISNRETKTVVEVPVGSTLSIGGMFQDTLRQQISQMPGVGNIPILGALFRSRDFIHEQTELVILVTPYLVTPGAAPALPTDGVVATGDAEANFLGHMEKLYGVGNPDTAAGGYRGSIGFALE